MNDITIYFALFAFIKSFQGTSTISSAKFSNRYVFISEIGIKNEDELSNG